MWYCNCHCKWFLSRRLRMRSKGECRDPTSLLCMERRRRWCQLWLSRRLWGNLCKEMMMIACKVHELCVKQCHPRADYWGSFCLLLLSAVVQKQIFRWCRNGHLCTISFHLEAFCRCKFEAGLAQHATIAPQWRLAQLNIIGGKKCSRSWQTPKGPPAWSFVETP